MVETTPSQFRNKSARLDETTSPYAFLEAFAEVNGLDSVSEDSAHDLARHKILMAQVMYERDGENSLVNALIHDAVYLEFKELEFSDDDNENLQKVEEIAFLFGDDTEYPEGSPFAKHLQSRTMDLLMEVEEEYELQLEGSGTPDGRVTQYTGTYKTEAAESLKQANKKLENDKAKVTMLLNMAEDVYGASRHRTLDIDG